MVGSWPEANREQFANDWAGLCLKPVGHSEPLTGQVLLLGLKPVFRHSVPILDGSWPEASWAQCTFD